MELVWSTHNVSSSVLIWDAETFQLVAALYRSWTVYKRLVTKSWPTMESASPKESLPQSWSGMLRPGLPKKGEVCEKYFGNRTFLLCWTDLELCTRDGWLYDGVVFTHKVFSSVLIWDAKTWSTKKWGRMWKLFGKQDCFAALNRSWTVYKRWVT